MKHCKICIEEDIPEEYHVQEFCRKIKENMKSDPPKAIVVFCLDGHNFTGYMVRNLLQYYIFYICNPVLFQCNSALQLFHFL